MGLGWMMRGARGRLFESLVAWKGSELMSGYGVLSSLGTADGCE